MAQWTKPPFQYGWIQVQLSDIHNVLKFLLSNLFFTYAQANGKQENGLAMGSAFASALCVLTLTVYEWQGNRTNELIQYKDILKKEDAFFHCFRYVDDLRIITVCSQENTKTRGTQIIDNIKKHIWNSISPLKLDQVNATIGTLLHYDKKQIYFFQMVPHP